MEVSASGSFNRIAISLPKPKPISFPFNPRSSMSASLHQGIRSRPSPLAFFPFARSQRHPILRFRKAIPDGGDVAVDRESGGEKPLPLLDKKLYKVLPDESISYLDEQDIVTLLDPPRELKPLNPKSYNPAAYLWKKIDDIPEERRPRLLDLLEPRLISRLWSVAGTRYVDSKLVKKISSSVSSSADRTLSPEYWSCRTSGGPFVISWINYFKKAIFLGNNGNLYGRIFLGQSLLRRSTDSFYPLYFTVSHTKEVMSTEQPCDLAYEFGDGLLPIHEYPSGFPEPAKHPWPFDDQVVVYIRHAGPGVMVGQAWQEGKALEQVPKKFCNEILMVKDCVDEAGP